MILYNVYYRNYYSSYRHGGFGRVLKRLQFFSLVGVCARKDPVVQLTVLYVQNRVVRIDR